MRQRSEPFFPFVTAGVGMCSMAEAQRVLTCSFSLSVYVCVCEYAYVCMWLCM